MRPVWRENCTSGTTLHISLTYLPGWRHIRSVASCELRIPYFRPSTFWQAIVLYCCSVTLWNYFLDVVQSSPISLCLPSVTEDEPIFGDLFQIVFFNFTEKLRFSICTTVSETVIMIQAPLKILIDIGFNFMLSCAICFGENLEYCVHFTFNRIQFTHRRAIQYR